MNSPGPGLTSSDRTVPAIGALAGLSLAMLLSSLGTSIANVALPTLAEAFGTTFQGAQWIVLSYLLATTTLIVSIGRLGDIAGRRRLLLAGICLFTGASILCGIASTFWFLIAARMAQGFGAATMMALTIAFVTEIVPKAKTGSAMGLLGTMSAVGTALGPSLGGFLIGLFDWRAIFLLNVPLGLVALFLTRRHLPADSRGSSHSRAGIDKAGMLLLAVTLAAYSFAMTDGRGGFGPRNAVWLLTAACGALLFWRIEALAESPLIRFAAFRDRVLSGSLAMNALVSTVMMATLVVGPFYLSLALNLSAAQVGLVMSVGPFVAALTGIPAGRFVDRFGAARMAVIGLTGITAGCALLAAIPLTFGVIGYIIPLAILTTDYALFQAANNTAIMTNVNPEQRGVISGLLNLSRNLGLITGASLMGAIFTVAVGASDVKSAGVEEVAFGMRATFGAGTVFIAGALAVAFMVRPRSKTTSSH